MHRILKDDERQNDTPEMKCLLMCRQICELEPQSSSDNHSQGIRLSLLKLSPNIKFPEIHPKTLSTRDNGTMAIARRCNTCGSKPEIYGVHLKTGKFDMLPYTWCKFVVIRVKGLNWGVSNFKRRCSNEIAAMEF